MRVNEWRTEWLTGWRTDLLIALCDSPSYHLSIHSSDRPSVRQCSYLWLTVCKCKIKYNFISFCMPLSGVYMRVIVRLSVLCSLFVQLRGISVVVVRRAADNGLWSAAHAYLPSLLSKYFIYEYVLVYMPTIVSDNVD